MNKDISQYIPPVILKHRFFIAICCVTILSLFTLVYFAPYGARNYLKLMNELSVITAEISELQQENIQLNIEIERLKNDSTYIEEIARKKYGMLKKDEIVYDFSKKKK